MPSSSQATQTDPGAAATSQAVDSDGLAAGQRLSLEEMSRIMDVAATLRKERALVDQQLNIEQIKAKLRERLLEAAKISGDPVTAEEIDAAVRQYYEQLHEFREPPAGFHKFLAHVWVSRGPILKTLAVIAAAIAVVWGMLAAGILPGKVRNERLAAAATAEFASRLETAERIAASIRQLSKDAEVEREVASLVTAARAAAERQQSDPLVAAIGKLDALQQELNLAYTVVIANRSGEQTGLDRFWTDENGTRTSGLYVFVEARDARGDAVQVPIENRETGRIESVSRWAEQVPAEVYERLKADKQADGVLDEHVLGEKRRGERGLQITLPGPNGAPIARQGQLTSW